MARHPSLSVITPVFNGIHFIGQCIENVIGQQCDSVEHVIVDGGSTDGTVEVIRKYASEYEHIVWISERDGGQSDALNKGMQMAKGNILSSLNVDDYYESGAFATVLDRFKVLSEPSLLVGNCKVWGENGKLLWVNRPQCLSPEKLLTGNEKHYPWPVNASAYFYHKSLHDSIGYYDTGLHHVLDLDFIIRAIMHCNAEYIDVTLGNFRFIPGTKTYQDMKFGEGAARFRRFIAEYRKKLVPTARALVIAHAFCLGLADRFSWRR